MSLWYTETFNDNSRFGLKVTRTLHDKRSEFQRIELFDTELVGTTLALDGLFQTSEVGEQVYHEMIAHPALCCAPKIDRVLVIGGGDGGTSREVLRHREVAECVLVEIDGDVVEACKEHLPGHGAWDDPRLELVIGDGIQYVADAAPGSFDVVLLDNSDPVGPSEGLFNSSFYQDVKRCMSADGVFALQSESPVLMAATFHAIISTLSELFTSVHPYFGPVLIYGASQWSWAFASNRVDPLAPIDARSELIEQTSRYYNRAIHRGAFAVPNQLARDLAASAAAGQ